MKNFVKVATLAATLVLVACQTNPNTNVFPKEDPVNSRHVADSEKQIWTSGDYDSAAVNGERTDKLCWQTGYYPDGNAVVGCDAVAAPKVEDAELNFDANALFDFDKATLRPMGQQALSSLSNALKSVTFRNAVVVGHTDSMGSDAYNDRLSLRRAEAVKAFLVSQGISAQRITTQGMGERQLKVQPSTCTGNRAAKIACEQPNRRVSVSLNGIVVPANKVTQWENYLKTVPGVNVRTSR